MERTPTPQQLGELYLRFRDRALAEASSQIEQRARTTAARVADEVRSRAEALAVALKLKLREVVADDGGPVASARSPVGRGVAAGAVVIGFASGLALGRRLERLPDRCPCLWLGAGLGAAGLLAGLTIGLAWSDATASPPATDAMPEPPAEPGEPGPTDS